MNSPEFLQALADLRTDGEVDEILNNPEKYRFQLTANERGDKLRAWLEPRLGRPIEGLAVLDVGCAYGGFSVALGRAGAKVLGVDLAERFITVARANGAGLSAVEFMALDATAPDFVDRVHAQAGSIDLVLLNDVFEHIYDTAALVEHITAVSAPDAQMYFRVPNGHATRHVMSEGHRKIFGLSVTDPDDWRLLVSSKPSVFYRRWAHYQALLHHFGWETPGSVTEYAKGLNNPVPMIREQLAEIREALGAAQKTFDERQFRAVNWPVRRYLAEAERDLGRLEPRALYDKYIATFWEGLVSRRGHPGAITAVQP